MSGVTAGGTADSDGRFDTAGLVTLRCDIHQHMRGLVLVLNTPYFVVTSSDGRFHLSGLPTGDYTLKAWIDSKTTLAKPVHLKNGGTLHVDSMKRNHP